MQFRRYKIIGNPSAGRGRCEVIIRKVRGIFGRKALHFHLEETRGHGDAERIAREATREFDVIIALGGDGTVNEIAQGMVFSEKPLAVIPGGSCNDLIKSLGYPGKIDDIIEFIIRGERARSIDTGRFGGRYFINVVGIGLDAAVNHETRNLRHMAGFKSYLLALFRTLRRYKPVSLKVFLSEETVSSEVLFLTIGNGTTCGGGFKLTPYARVDDGLLDITIVSPMPIPALLWHLPKAFSGDIDKVHYTTMKKTRKLRLENTEPIPVHLDGEPLILESGLHEIDLVPSSLRVLS